VFASGKSKSQTNFIMNTSSFDLHNGRKKSLLVSRFPDWGLVCCCCQEPAVLGSSNAPRQSHPGSSQTLGLYFCRTCPDNLKSFQKHGSLIVREARAETSKKRLGDTNRQKTATALN
jgi:hypothetical protein